MSRSAIAFVTEVVAAHGRDLGGERVEVPLSQAEMARRQGCSAGTVAYYLRAAGDVVVSRRRGGLVVDVAALDAAAFHPVAARAARATQPPSGPRHLRIAEAGAPTAGPSCSTPALTGDQVVEVVSTLARCLTQVSCELGALGNQLLGAIQAPANPANRAEAPRQFAGQAATSANVAGGFSLEKVLRKEESLPSSLEPETRELRGSVPDVAASTGAPSLPYDLVDELVAPLRAYARRCGRPDTLDDNGRRRLATLSESELRHGVQRAQRECEADRSITKPLGLLVHKVRTAREDFFAAPPPAPQPRALVVVEPEASVDEEAMAAVAALEDGIDAGELALVDEEVRTWLAANVAKESIQQVMLRKDQRGLRQAAWRRLHPRRDDEVAELAG